MTRGRLRAGRGNAAFWGAIITHWSGDWHSNSVAATVPQRSYMTTANLERAFLTSGGASNRVPRSSHVRNLLPTSTGTEPPPLGQSSFSYSQKKNKISKYAVGPFDDEIPMRLVSSQCYFLRRWKQDGGCQGRTANLRVGGQPAAPTTS